MVVFLVWGAVLGACLGSFLNVVASRALAGEPWGGIARSRCPGCGRTLSWRELIPLVSFFMQRGRCRGCAMRIAWRYPAVELAGAVIGTAMGARWGLIPEAWLISTIAVFFLLLNTLTDLDEGVIFDLFALAPGVLGLLLRGIVGGTDPLLDGLVGAAVGYGTIAAVIVTSRVITGQEGMGWGDANLMAGTGALLGWKMNVVALYIGIMAGGLLLLPLLLVGKVHRKDAVPLGPFLALGCLGSLLGGPAILAWLDMVPGWPW